MNFKKAVVLMLILLILLAACKKPIRGPGSNQAYDKITLITDDNLNITARYYESDSDKGIILLHMLGKNSNSFQNIAPKLINDYKIIAIDLRGHGTSDKDFSQMSDREFREAILDLKAAAQFLHDQEISSLNIMGASIGANLALKYASTNNVDKLVLISPASAYKSIDIAAIHYTKSLLVQVAYYDAFSAISVDDLEGNWDIAQVKRYNDAAHGTDLYENIPQALKDALMYLDVKEEVTLSE